MPKYDLIAEEIKWCESHRNPAQEVYQDGFIAGLRHALFLMKSRPAVTTELRRNNDMTIERIYKCTRCGELWSGYELHGNSCGDVTCGGSVVEVTQALDGAGEL